MIDLSKIFDASLNESVQLVVDGSKCSPENDPEYNELLAQSNVHQAHLTFAYSLIEKYHEALREELAKQGIEI